jgi:hypothetical protein
MTTAYGTSIDAIAERVLREDAMWDVKTLLTAHAPEDLTACELLAILVILRGAKERLEAQQRPAAPVLKLSRGRKSSRAKGLDFKSHPSDKRRGDQ